MDCSPEFASPTFTIGAESRSPTPLQPGLAGEAPVGGGPGSPGNQAYLEVPSGHRRLAAYDGPEQDNQLICSASRNASGDCLLPVELDGPQPQSNGNGLLKKALGFDNYTVSLGSELVSPSSVDLTSTNGALPVPPRSESLWRTGAHVFIAFILAGFGNMGAGLLLDRVQHWTAFCRISEFFILVPSLQGLKGNLEMTMASRLSTQANLGRMDDMDSILTLAKGNLALIQSQATVVAFLASIIAILVNSWVGTGGFELKNAAILMASSLVTANVACFLLGVCMICVIVYSHRLHVDPDNIATPVAASLGDLITCALLAFFAHTIYNHTYAFEEQFPYLAIGIIVIFISLLPFWVQYAYKTECTKKVVSTGWTPVILAMIVSSIGGVLLDFGTHKYERIALFQPIINGVGGNLAAIQSSRLSTYLHVHGKRGQFPGGYTTFTNPYRAFFGHDMNVKTARILLFMAIPAHLLYVFTIRLLKPGDEFSITPYFLLLYITFAVFQVLLLLYLAFNLVLNLWKLKIDPDNSSIPILTSLGDLLGSAFILTVFLILASIGDPMAMKPVTISNHTLICE